MIGSLSSPDTDITAKIILPGASYEIQDPLRAFQIFFKLLIALNLEFPGESANVWHFVEKFIFKIERTLSITSQVRTVINEFSHLLNSH